MTLFRWKMTEKAVLKAAYIEVTMQFDPAIHTKSFLLENHQATFELAMRSFDFAKSNLADDIEILRLRDSDGLTVAHTLARFHLNWVNSDAASNIEILGLTNDSGWTVAHELLDRKSCLSIEPIFTKQILTISFDGKIIAEKIVNKYSGSVSLDVMAMKLISQGAAYIHSLPMNSAIAYKVLNQTKKLVEDCFNQEVNLKITKALYSTFFHNIERLKSNNVPSTSDTWPSLLSTAEQMIKKVLLENPALYDADIQPDFYCEPAQEVINRLKSERVLSLIDTGYMPSTEIAAECAVKNALY